jgi:hypothetical protein
MGESSIERRTIVDDVPSSAITAVVMNIQAFSFSSSSPLLK